MTTRTTACIAIAAAVAAAVLAAPAAAPAVTSCAFDDDAGGALDVELAAAGDVAYLSVAPGGEIIASGAGGQVFCTGGTPTVTTTSAIFVFNRPGATGTIVVIAGASRFGPGVTVADENGGSREIEIFVNLHDERDSKLWVAAGEAGGSIRFGANGINPNAFPAELVPDADIFLRDVPDGALLGLGGAGPDDLNAQGGAGTGGALGDRVLLRGAAGADSLTGGSGADTIFGDEANDDLSGAGGDDTILPGADGDSVAGGPGRDAVAYSDHFSGVSVDLAVTGPQATGASGPDSLATVEDVFGSVESDVLRGDGGSNRLVGDGGADVLEGRGGADVLEGGAGADSLDVRDGAPDSADCGTETDTVSADRAGTDALFACEHVVFSSGAPTGGGEPASDMGADVFAPAFLGRVRAVPARFGVRRHRNPGTTFRYSLSEAATVSFAIERRTSGRRVNGACRARTRANAGRPRCSRFTRVSSFDAHAAAGANATPFSGHIATRPLKPGAYRASVTAEDVAGNRSKQASVNLRVTPRSTRAHG